MPTFYIENRPKGAKYRRMAVVYASDKNNALEKLLERFPDAVDCVYIEETRLINPALATIVIK